MRSDQTIQLTDIIGKSGRYQRIVFLVSFYYSWFLGTSWVTMDLLVPTVTIYWDWDKSNPNKTTFSSNDCKMDVIANMRPPSNVSNSSSKLVFESEYSRITLTEKLNLVCDRYWLVSFTNFLSLFAPALCGLFLRLSEKFGRRSFIMLSAALSLLFNLCMSFPVGYTMFALAFFLFKGSLSITHMLLFVQAVEITAPSRRQYIGVFVKSGLLVGQTVLVCASWLLKDWFYTQLFQTALVATLLPAVWYVQESPVFLAVRGKYEESKKGLLIIVKRNGLNVNELEPKINNWLGHMKVHCEIESKAEKGKLKDLFKNRTISLYTFGLAFNFFTASFIFSSLMLNAESFGSGLYVDLTASNAFSLFSVLIVAALLTRISIRVILFIAFLLEGLTCIMYSVCYSVPLARTIISILSRVFISAVYANTRIYMNEVYPTSVRGVGAGFITFVGLVLASPSPFTKELGEKTYIYVPFVLFAVLSLASALVNYLMPETRKRPISHTIHDLNGLHDNKNGKESRMRNIYVIQAQTSKMNVRPNENVELTSF